MNINAEELADVVVDTILRSVRGPLVAARFLAIEERVAALEQKPFVKFCGAWERKAYPPGAAVVYDGRLWFCRAETTGEPSKDYVGWQVAVKAGPR